MHNKTQHVLRATLALTFLATGSSPIPSFADEDASVIEEVVVTGSRIQRANLTQPNPVYGLDASDIKATGEQSLIEVGRG